MNNVETNLKKRKKKRTERRLEKRRTNLGSFNDKNGQ